MYVTYSCASEYINTIYSYGSIESVANLLDFLIGQNSHSLVGKRLELAFHREILQVFPVVFHGHRGDLSPPFRRFHARRHLYAGVQQLIECDTYRISPLKDVLLVAIKPVKFTRKTVVR